MTTLNKIKAAEGFSYLDVPQGSPDWIATRAGKVGSSELGAWLAVSKRDGKPLKARQDLERKIAYEKAFNVAFSTYVTGAMQDGIDNEDFVRQQYSSQIGVPVETCGVFYNEHFASSPDGLVGEDGLVEIKWLQDTNYSEVVSTKQPLPDHYAQMQGQMYATGRKWVDYVPANGNTGTFAVIRVERDEEFIANIAESVVAVKDIKPMERGGVFNFTTDAPQAEEVVWS